MMMILVREGEEKVGKEEKAEGREIRQYTRKR